MFEAMLNDIRNSPRDLSSSDNEQDGVHQENNEQDTELGKLSDDDEPGWGMGTIFNAVQDHMESVRLKQIWLDELTQLRCGGTANYFGERDMKNGTAELQIPAVVKHLIDTTAATPSPTIFGEHMRTLDIVSEQSHMPAGTSQLACS
jgi:hypothetical protein